MPSTIVRAPSFLFKKSSISMNIPIQPTSLILSAYQPHICVNEYNLSIMQKISQIITNRDYKPFKLKTKKQAQIYTQYYVTNSPHTDHAFEHLQNIQPISTLLLQHPSFKLSQSVKAVQNAYTNLGYNSDGPINPILLHNEHYVEGIKPAVDAFVYELKSHSTSKISISDREQRVALIKEIRKANVPVMKKLFKTHQRFNLNVFTYIFHMQNCESSDKPIIEQGLTRQISNMIDQFLENHQSEILALFFCIQRDLSNNYVLTIYCATERECQPLSMKDYIPLRDGNYMILSPYSNITLSIYEANFPMDIQDVDGINEKSWKDFFGQSLSKYNYVYYKSKFVSPDFFYKKR